MNQAQYGAASASIFASNAPSTRPKISMDMMSIFEEEGKDLEEGAEGRGHWWCKPSPMRVRLHCTVTVDDEAVCMPKVTDVFSIGVVALGAILA